MPDVSHRPLARSLEDIKPLHQLCREGRFLTCATTPSPDFSLSISPSSKRVGSAGGTVTYTVTIVRTGDFTGNVAFTATGLTGIPYAFNPNPVSASSGNSSVLTVTVDPNTPAGNYIFTVTGTTIGSLSHQVSATLVKGKGKK